MRHSIALLTIAAAVLFLMSASSTPVAVCPGAATVPVDAPCA